MPNKTWFTIINKAGETPEVQIYDYIGEYAVSATQFCDALKSIKAAKINLRINSGGGDVFDAAAMCTAIREHDAEITAHVDGFAASAASVVAMACDIVEMGEQSWMMIHNASGMCFGTADDMRKEAARLENVNDNLVGLYAKETGNTKEDVKAAMDEEKWFDAKQAVEWGLADKVKGGAGMDGDDGDDEEGDDEEGGWEAKGKRAFASLAPFILSTYGNVPQRLKDQIAKAAAGPSPQLKIEPRQQSSVQEGSEMPNKLIERGGKYFSVHEGKEIEVELPPATARLELPTEAKSEQEIAATAVAKERAYRKMFDTTAAAAGLTGEAAKKFEQFYGRPEADVKFLAEGAIGARASAVGEGSGNGENANPQKDESTDQIRAYCVERLKNDKLMRQTFRVVSADPHHPSFKEGLEKFVAVESNARNDWAKSKGKKDTEQDAIPIEDPIAKVLKNNSVIDYVD